jgi:hypothetical protein
MNCALARFGLAVAFVVRDPGRAVVAVAALPAPIAFPVAPNLLGRSGRPLRRNHSTGNQRKHLMDWAPMDARRRAFRKVQDGRGGAAARLPAEGEIASTAFLRASAGLLGGPRYSYAERTCRPDPDRYSDALTVGLASSPGRAVAGRPCSRPSSPVDCLQADLPLGLALVT